MTTFVAGCDGVGAGILAGIWNELAGDMCEAAFGVFIIFIEGFGALLKFGWEKLVRGEEVALAIRFGEDELKFCWCICEPCESFWIMVPCTRRSSWRLC